MQDRPTQVELLEAVREFLETEILPRLEGDRIRFRTRVAMNALTILAREAELEEAIVREEYRELSALLGYESEPNLGYGDLRKALVRLNGELASRIRAGDKRPAIVEFLRRTAERKLAVASPAYLERNR